MPRGKDALGNDTLLFGDKSIRTIFDRGGRPLLALPDVLVLCGLNPKTRTGLDIRGRSETYPFMTPGGRQKIRAIDLDDTYRVAMQGITKECKAFRDFIIEILRKLESGGTISAGPAPSVPAPSSTASPLTQTVAALMQVCVRLDEQDRRLHANEQRVDALAASVNRAMGWVLSRGKYYEIQKR